MNNALDPTNCERNDEKILIQSVAIIMPSLWFRNKHKVYDLIPIDKVKLPMNDLMIAYSRKN
jgi:hypothetical protein